MSEPGLRSKGSEQWLQMLTAALLIGIFAFHLGSAAAGKSFIRASHLGVALNYAKGPIDLLRPVMPGFNATGTPTAQEPPLWQAAAGLAFKLAGSTWFGWANLASLVLFAGGLWPFFQICRQYMGQRAAWWATAFLLAQPLIVIMAGEAATDGFCLVLSLWFLYFADAFIRTGAWRFWWPAVLFAMLAAVSKLPFFAAVGLGSVGLLLVNRVRSWRTWVMLGAVGALAGVAVILWSRYTDALAAQAEFPYYDLRLSQNPDLVQRFFGDLNVRLNVPLWVRGFWRVLHATLGCLPMAALLIAALLRPTLRMAKLWLLATFLSTLIFTPLVLDHWHYYLMCCPPVAMLCGSTLAKWDDFWSQEIPRPWLRGGVVLVMLLFSAIDGLISLRIALDYDSFRKDVSEVIRAHTRPTDKLIVYGDPNWGGEVLFRSDRQGLSVLRMSSSEVSGKARGLRDLLDTPEYLKRLKELGFNKVVLLSESPVLYAIQASNPGARRSRFLYPESISKTVDAWPVVYRSDDLLIKDIP